MLRIRLFFAQKSRLFSLPAFITIQEKATIQKPSQIARTEENTNHKLILTHGGVASHGEVKGGT